MRRRLVPSAQRALPWHIEVQRECQSSLQSLAIEEMVEGAELISNCGKQAMQNEYR